ncbi:MAG: hypothetical protein LBV39_01300, partial [Bacteroidales bacterium]|nr:hypothetical protein [Bacteroidales bacterium]
EGKEFSIAGLVTTCKDAISKSGKPWGALTLEDLSGSYEFRFFGEDYNTYRAYLHEGLPLFIRGTIRRNFRQELEPKITRISYLSSVRDDLLKSVSLLLPLERISDAWMNDLSALMEAHQGKTLLKFNIFDRETKQAVEMFSRKQRIDLNNELITNLENFGVEFKLN